MAKMLLPTRHSARLRRQSTETSSHAITVFNLGDIMQQVLAYSNIGWGDLITLSHAIRTGRVTARNEITKRLTRYLSPFIPVEFFNTFFDILSKHNGVICGSIVWLLISGEEQYMLRRDKPYFCAEYPRDLNIMVPCGEAVGLMDALLANNIVELWSSVWVYETHSNVVMNTFKGKTAQVRKCFIYFEIPYLNSYSAPAS